VPLDSITTERESNSKKLLFEIQKRKRREREGVRRGKYTTQILVPSTSPPLSLARSDSSAVILTTFVACTTITIAKATTPQTQP
jgi:hypothetical protein